MTWVPPFAPEARLFPFQSRWWDADVPDADYTGRVHYVDEGSGPPLLLIHGNPTWSFLWRGVIIRLRKRFRCIALDLPGFGLSQGPEGQALRPEEHADVVAAFVRQLDLRDVVIAGHDWGGPIGLRVACDDVTRLRGLVMSNTFYWPLETIRHRTLSYAMSTAPAQKAIVHGDFLIERALPQGVVHAMLPEVVDQYREAFASPSRRHGAARFPRELIRSTGWLSDLAEDVPRHLANVPLLLAWGVRDPAFPPQMMDRFRDDFRLVKVSRLEAKNLVPEDVPSELCEAIGMWADTLG